MTGGAIVLSGSGACATLASGKIGEETVATLRKLYDAAVNNPKAVRFEELDKLLRRAGFEVRQPRSGSSHYFYRKGAKIISIPRHAPYLKAPYVKEALALLEGELDGDRQSEKP